ncbi:hypothetical protein ACIF9R_10690 [Streptomyces sp. NPDC086080]|uniref:hypothetical protein n=1 Tax=Streptomyces sp. NPDC086080 TaxID=3365748 RepID=UPI0037D04D39
MADAAPEVVRTHLIDLSTVPLDELTDVDGLARALAGLRSQLTHAEAPLCQGQRPSCAAGATGRRPDPDLAVVPR